MVDRIRQKIFSFLSSDNEYPIIYGIASGLYPILFCYNKNFTLVNSFDHFIFFIFSFLGLPILIFKLAHYLLNKFNHDKHVLTVFSFLNIVTFLYLIKIITFHGLHLKKTIFIFFVAIFFAIFLKKHFKKVVIVQYILVLIILPNLISSLYSFLSVNNEWKNQPDTIESVMFKNKPNIYFIQPDGYVNFSEIEKGYYKYNNIEFKSFLLKNNFQLYDDFRSNYTTTLSSNASLFAMKHHYYNNRTYDFELYNARNTIITKNPVLDVLKKNNYKTYFLSETDYLFYNRPEISYDYCNISLKDIPFVSPGISEPLDIREEVINVVSEITNQPKFVYIELLKPWHINSKKPYNRGKEKEREVWLDNLKRANEVLTDYIKIIKNSDPNALIIVMSDHGGYVGFNYGDESKSKIQNRDLIYSIFSSQLAILWPKNEKPDYDKELKSPVNLFRILFSHLADDKSLLKHLQPNESYIVLTDKNNNGIYKYIDEKGKISFKKHVED